MPGTSGRAVRVFAASLIGMCAVAFGVAGWLTYGSVVVAVLAAATVLGEGAAIVLIGERVMSRRRRHRSPPPPPPNPADPDWVPEGWDLPPYERNPPGGPPT